MQVSRRPSTELNDVSPLFVYSVVTTHCVTGLGGSRHLLFHPTLFGGEGVEHVGRLGVELHHLLVDEWVLAALGLQLLALLHQVGVGQHLAVLGHLLDHSLVVALQLEER